MGVVCLEAKTLATGIKAVGHRQVGEIDLMIFIQDAVL